MAINSNTESWNNHSFSEVETHIKNRFNELEYNGHAYVEIGGLKWATMNIGANSITDYGQYFQWGDTTGYVAANVGTSSTANKKPFAFADYKFGNGTSSQDMNNLTKYNTTDGKTVLDKCDDAARANWGGLWRMPTSAEFQALGNAVNASWTNSYNSSGVAGLVCTAKTDSSKVLFFPAAGYFEDGSVKQMGNVGEYSSSTCGSGFIFVLYSYTLHFYNSSTIGWNTSSMRYYGRSVRPVIG